MAGETTVGSIKYDLDLDDSKFKDKAKDAESRVNRLGSAFENAEEGSRMFAGGLVAVATGLAGVLGYGVKIAADLETSEQGFVTLLGSTEKAHDAIEMIKRDAAATPFEIPGLVKANQLLTSVTKDADRSEGLLLNIGKALAAMGKSGTELDNVIFNLQQIGNTGKITEMDIRQFGNAGINILELLADHYGVTKEVAGDMVKNSKDAFADLEAAFEKAGTGSGQFAQAFELQAGTFNQVMSNMRDNFGNAMSEIAKKTGLFDSVKDAIKKVTDALGELAKPENIDKIIEFMNQLKENLPVIVGIILGGLAPAMWAFVAPLALAMFHLAPFLIIGGLIGIMIQKLVEHFGGLDEIMRLLEVPLRVVGQVFDEFIKPTLSEIWTLLKDALIPELKLLWEQISPILIPVLKILGTLLAGAVFAAILIVINVLKAFVMILIEVVAGVRRFVEDVKKFFQGLYDFLVGNSIIPDLINGIIDWFASLPGKIINALAGLFDAIASPFRRAFDEVKRLAQEVWESLQKINPFHRQSPSLIDNVMRGVDIIKKQYASLGDIALPSVNLGANLQPALLGSESGNVTNQTIYMNVDKVGDMQDVAAVGREFGFRIGIVPK